VLTKQIGPVLHSVATGHNALFKLRVNHLNYLRLWWALQGLNLRPLPCEGNSISRKIKELVPVGIAPHRFCKGQAGSFLRVLTATCWLSWSVDRVCPL
jgi:hypothetical protein